jgi:hypothetical protein
MKHDNVEGVEWKVEQEGLNNLLFISVFLCTWSILLIAQAMKERKSQMNVSKFYYDCDVSFLDLVV